MPSTERVRVKRRLDQAFNQICVAVMYIQEEGDKFKDTHPEHYYLFQGLVDYFEVGAKFLQSLTDKI